MARQNSLITFTGTLGNLIGCERNVTLITRLNYQHLIKSTSPPATLQVSGMS